MPPPLKKGLLLINLGTPDAPTTSAVRRYLREFLSDPRVIDINPIARWLLLNLVILPTRPQRSAAAYKNIWTGRGSPLLCHTGDLAAKGARAVEGDFEAEGALRYGCTAIGSGADRVVRNGDAE